MSLNGKVALVTGGSRGIGAATAIRLAKEGADVAITYAKSPKAAEEVVAKIKALGRKAVAIKADSSVTAEVTGLLARVKKELGGIHIVVNNAGTFTAAPLGQASEEAFDKEIAINVKAIFTILNEAANVLEKGARIINVGSVVGGRAPFAGLSIYATSKFAVQGITRAAARDLGAKGILVNAVQPGPIATDMNPDEGDFATVLKAQTILGRFGVADEVAGAVAFLAGPDANYITGTTLNVDGGMEA
ncbi:SDR family oxidoreductase [bacterium]|nr:SDR family oxidoreductase [bacterium]